MQDVIILVNDTPEGVELQRQIIELMRKNEATKNAIVLPGYIKKPT